LVRLLAAIVGFFKVGLTITSAMDIGPAIRIVKDAGGKVFLDLKFHDIPAQVADAVEAACMRDVDIITLHVAGGPAMMKLAVAARDRAAEKTGHRAMLFGITVLTSLSYDDLAETGDVPSVESYCASYRDASRQPPTDDEIKQFKENQLEHLVTKRARLAMECGLDGVVASPLEIKAIREACGPDILIIAPGIRPYWAAAEDQKRVGDPQGAIEDGADMLVVGRPITEQFGPEMGTMENAAKWVLNAIRQGLEVCGKWPSTAP
jgi:orotidine-5'-phosphate decarboxylase